MERLSHLKRGYCLWFLEMSMKDLIEEIRNRVEGIEKQVGILPKPWMKIVNAPAKKAAPKKK